MKGIFFKTFSKKYQFLRIGTFGVFCNKTIFERAQKHEKTNTKKLKEHLSDDQCSKPQPITPQLDQRKKDKYLHTARQNVFNYSVEQRNEDKQRVAAK